MDGLMAGVSAYPTADVGLLRDAGVRWVRKGFRFPFRGAVGGELTEEYREDGAGGPHLRRPVALAD